MATVFAALHGQPADTPRDAKLSNQELRIDRFHLARQEAGENLVGPVLPLTDRIQLGARRRNLGGPENSTGLYGVPNRPPRIEGRRHIQGPGPAEPREEPIYEHLRRVDGPQSARVAHEPALHRLNRSAARPADDEEGKGSPEGLKILKGLPALSERVGEVVFGGRRSDTESAEAEFTRLLGQAAGKSGWSQQPLESVKIFPEALTRRGQEQALQSGRRHFPPMSNAASGVAAAFSDEVIASPMVTERTRSGPIQPRERPF